MKRFIEETIIFLLMAAMTLLTLFDFFLA